MGKYELDEFEVFFKTLYAECRGEPRRGQEWVGCVIKNRARRNKSYWGGNTIKGVCLYNHQFECWTKKDDIHMDSNEFSGWARNLELSPQNYESVKAWVWNLYQSTGPDPSKGADHYNNPNIGGYPKWTENCDFLEKIG